MNRWLIVSLCGWAVSYLASRQAYVFLLFFCLFALLYFSLRFSSRRYSLFFLVFSCALTLHNLPAGEPPDGLYTVYEVKKEYCLPETAGIWSSFMNRTPRIMTDLKSDPFRRSRR